MNAFLLRRVVISFKRLPCTVQPRPQKPPARGATAGFARGPRVFVAHRPPTTPEFRPHAPPRASRRSGAAVRAGTTPESRMPLLPLASRRHGAVCRGGTTTGNRLGTPPRANHRPCAVLRGHCTIFGSRALLWHPSSLEQASPKNCTIFVVPYMLVVNAKK